MGTASLYTSVWLYYSRGIFDGDRTTSEPIEFFSIILLDKYTSIWASSTQLTVFWLSIGAFFRSVCVLR